MMLQLFRRNFPNASIARLYGAIVAQARAAPFYQSYGVPDTVNGRFEMLVLHMVLVLRRLEGERPPGRALGQRLFDWFCRDMDGSLREMGVGDLAVPAKMRKIGEAFFGRQEAYLQALSAADPEALVAALTRNVFEEEPPPYVVAHSASKDARDRADAGEAREGASRLAAYTREAARRLAEQGEEALGRITFPDPEAVVAADEAPTRDAAP